jgi:hypothetical protein
MTKNLPATLLETKRMVSEAAAWVPQLRSRLEPKHSREWLETQLRQGLCDGVLTLTEKAIEAVKQKKDEIADAALRTVFQELISGALVKRGPGHLQILAFGQLAIKRPPLSRRPGRYHWTDNWMRDLEICFLVGLACAQFNLLPTRNREAQRADSTPSGISIVVAALDHNGIHLDESTVQENIWFGLPGELARHALAEWALRWWSVQ